ncbi:MAG: serine/threonine protein phosphatase PrpC [Candidatus Poriferisodalaceae bacterium]
MNEEAPQLRLAWGGATDSGRVRTSNQDAMFADRSLFMVADGMGGHQGGEVAANMTVRTVAGAPHDSEAALVSAIEAANKAVNDAAVARAELHGMGTTATAIAVVSTANGPRFALANVGDSRIYRFRGDTLHQLTFDHSYVAELMRRGDLTEEEAATHPYRNMLTRAVGVHAAVEIDHWELEPEPGDRYLLCSDGITNEISDEIMQQTLSRRQSAADAASELVGTANEMGGRDNSTVVIVDVMLAGADGTIIDPAAVAVPPPEPAAPAASEFATTFQIAETATDANTPHTADPDTDDLEADSPEPNGSDLWEADPATDLSETAAPEPVVPTPQPLTGSEPTITQPVINVAPDPAATPTLPMSFVVEEPTQESTGDSVSGTAAADAVRRMANERDEEADDDDQVWIVQSVEVTTRAVAVFLGLVLVLVGFFLAAGWYARSSYHVGIAGDEVAIFQGKVGGLLWFDPTLERRTGILVDELQPEDLSQLSAGHETASLDGALGFVDELETRLLDELLEVEDSDESSTTSDSSS